MNHKKMNNKYLRKAKLASHKICRDFDIQCTSTPMQFIAVCNAGLVTGLSRESLKCLLNNLMTPTDYEIIMPVSKSYSFIKFSSVDKAKNFYDQFNGVTNIKSDGTPLYLSYIESVPDEEYQNNQFPPGLRLVTNFVTEDEATKLLNLIDWDEDGETSELKHRKAKHFGYIFRYDNNKVDLENQIPPIPEKCAYLQTLFEKENCGFYKYDQLTINRYLPGQGIPPHIDTHSTFEDTILSLSLGSDCVMDFKKDNKKISISLPHRSLLIMTGEVRYAWSHGICPRHSDVVNNDDGLTYQKRNIRISYTFRKVRSSPCSCAFSEYCDNKTNTSNPELKAEELEHRYVHQVYNQISSHFSETRHKQWPNVGHFLNSLPIGSIIIDIGCGNGKYLTERPEIYKVGCDRSFGLIEISRQRGFEVLVADCLKLPYRDNSADAAISIAVIHHLSTNERRREAIIEMIRVLRPGGKLLIYVWAKSQKKDSVPSAYLKYNQGRKSSSKQLSDPTSTSIKKSSNLLPVHQNGTEFVHEDIFVPWKRKGGGEFLRYYHVFNEGELEELCSKIMNINIEKGYYDQGNWCIILNKLYS